MTEEELKEIEERCNAATKGPCASFIDSVVLRNQRERKARESNRYIITPDSSERKMAINKLI